jgi:hypothetical protein
MNGNFFFIFFGEVMSNIYIYFKQTKSSSGSLSVGCGEILGLRAIYDLRVSSFMNEVL